MEFNRATYFKLLTRERSGGCLLLVARIRSGGLRKGLSWRDEYTQLVVQFVFSTAAKLWVVSVAMGT